ncbi:MAG: hypothetical protein ACREJ2_09475 [Planctomycetota bacterium]
MTLQVYRSDGGFDMTRLPLFLLGSCLGGAVLGTLYQLASYYSPLFGYITVVILGGYALLLGKLTSVLGKWAHNRNWWLHLGATVLTCLVSYYVAWIVFTACILESVRSAYPNLASLPFCLVLPWKIGKLATALAASGYKTFGAMGSSSSGQTTISGAFVWLIWLVEAGVIFIVPPFRSHNYTADPYFTRSGSWGAKRTLGRTYSSPTAPASASKMLLDDSFSWMNDMRPAGGLNSLGFEFTEHPNEETAFLTITKTQLKTVKKQKVLKPVPFLAHIELTAAERRRVNDLLGAAPTQRVAAAAKKDDEIEVAGTWDQAKPAAPAAAAAAAPIPEVDPEAVAANWKAQRTAAPGARATAGLAAANLASGAAVAPAASPAPTAPVARAAPVSPWAAKSPGAAQPPARPARSNTARWDNAPSGKPAAPGSPTPSAPPPRRQPPPAAGNSNVGDEWDK